jgi:hypothetical protein
MKMMGRTTDFCGTKEKREKNERMISMGKKATAFFFPGSYFLFLLSSRFSQKKAQYTESYIISPICYAFQCFIKFFQQARNRLDVLC